MESMDDIINATEPSFTTEEDYGDLEDLMCERSSVRRFRAHYEPPLFWIITLLGGAGNLAVVWIYLNLRRRLKTMSDVYLLNLAVADLLFLLTLPLWAAEALQGWSFGPVLCRLVSALYKVNLFSSSLLLTCISLDRYVVIVQTIKAQNSQSERKRRSAAACVAVWLLALVLATPELVFSRTVPVDSQQYCRMVFPSHVGNWTKTLVLSLQVAMGFCIPVVVMVFCYSIIVAKLLGTRNFGKHRAIRTILVVVSVFVMSQLPHNVVLIIKAAQASNITMTDCEEMKHLDVVDQVLKSVAFTHACLNPLLYAFMGVRFRHDVMRLLPHCCRRRHMSSTKVSASVEQQHLPGNNTSQALSL